MNKNTPYRAGGMYLGQDGRWQSAYVVTDGRELLEFVGGQVTPDPQTVECDVLGIEATPDVDQPLSVTELAQETGATVISDMRQSDLVFGGRGTPLSPFYLHALARRQGATKPVVFLQLDQSASVVWIDPTIEPPETDGATLAFEAGPALGPIDLLHAQRPYGSYQGGTVADGALELFLDDPFFRRIPPKWLDDFSFDQMLQLVFELSDADAEATLCAMSATAIMLAVEHFPATPDQFLAYGRGTQHGMLKRMITAGLDAELTALEDWDIQPETLNAQSIAFLAVRALNGLPTTAPSTTGVKAAIGGATITRL